MRGLYEGELKDGVPHGVGEWENIESDKKDEKARGFWAEGRLEGFALIENKYGMEEYEVSGGKINGKWVKYLFDGSRMEREYKGGEQFGVQKQYDKKDVLIYEGVYRGYGT